VRRRLARRGAPQRGRARRWLRRGVLLAGAAGLACLPYAYLVEPYWLEVTRVSLRVPHLPAGARPVRIVHLTDLHCDPKVRLEDELPAVVASQRPDVILFTGDAINSPPAVGNFRRCMRRLADVAPVYAVKGNWDVRQHAGVDLFAGTGAHVLDGEAVRIETAGGALWLAGAPAGRWQEAERALRSVPAGACRVVLYHYPDRAYAAARCGAALYLAGHTHGGQVALPFYGALVTLSKYGKRFERGLRRVGGTWVYVGRGVGMEGGPVPRVRFCARPEVAVIELRPAR
jgi:hypothetical protein